MAPPFLLLHLAISDCCRMGVEVQGSSEAAPSTLTSVLIKKQSLNQQGFVSTLTLSLVLCSLFFTLLTACNIVTS